MENVYVPRMPNIIYQPGGGKVSDRKLFVLLLIFVLISAFKLLFPEINCNFRDKFWLMAEQEGAYREIIEAAGKSFCSDDFKDEIIRVLKTENKDTELQVIKLEGDLA